MATQDLLGRIFIDLENKPGYKQKQDVLFRGVDAYNLDYALKSLSSIIDNISGGGSGDMTKAVYDSTNQNTNIFDIANILAAQNDAQGGSITNLAGFDNAGSRCLVGDTASEGYEVDHSTFVHTFYCLGNPYFTIDPLNGIFGNGLKAYSGSILVLSSDTQVKFDVAGDVNFDLVTGDVNMSGIGGALKVLAILSSGNLDITSSSISINGNPTYSGTVAGAAAKNVVNGVIMN